MEKKDRINVLLNIDNFLGEHEGRLAPILIFIAVAAVPILLWLFILLPLGISVKWIILPWILWAIRWAFYILGNEPEKMAMYDKQRDDAYQIANELVGLSHPPYENGLIEYRNGNFCVLISGMLKDFLNDSKFSIELEKFLDLLNGWDYDIYCHNVVGELTCEENLPKLTEYVDLTVMHERMEFYEYQDEFSNKNSALYRYSFLLKAPKYKYKKLVEFANMIVGSEQAKIFNQIVFCDIGWVTDIMSRDICAYLDLSKMLMQKFSSDDYHGSKIVYYDDNVPEQLQPKSDSSNLEERRITNDK